VTSSGLLETGTSYSGKYELIGIVSHLGRNTDHGHYVCHLKKENQWIFFNDEKVLSSSSSHDSSSFDLGCLVQVPSIQSWLHVSF
jgi:uncharacterized UBP type Zn finger protein